jgi:hypothetical protein
MFKAFEFCLPTKAIKVPAGPEWLHEIKYDGYRLRVDRDGDAVRKIKTTPPGGDPRGWLTVGSARRDFHG